MLICIEIVLVVEVNKREISSWDCGLSGIDKVDIIGFWVTIEFESVAIVLDDDFDLAIKDIFIVVDIDGLGVVDGVLAADVVGIEL